MDEKQDSSESNVSNVSSRGLSPPSSLWIDQGDVHDRIARRLRRGEVDEETADGLRHFVDQGFLVFPLDVDATLFDEVADFAERCWRQKPGEIAYASNGPPLRMTYADGERDRRGGCRIHDLHSHNPAALELYLNRQIFDWVELFLGEEPVAIQSLYFEFGSEQAVHRDPVVVPIESHGHMIAAWIALEDVGPDCGPLIYVPGSHRLPYFETAPGEYRFDADRMGAGVATVGMAWEEEQRRRHGLEERLFTARRGEVLLWHASLAHGGSPIADPSRTRKSFVVHYSTRRTYKRRLSSRLKPPGGEGAGEVYENRRLLERDGCRGFESPLVGEPLG